MRSIEIHSESAVAEAATSVIENGAVVVRDMIPSPLIERLREDLTRATEEDAVRFGSRHPFPGIVHALMTRGASFLELLAVDGLRALCRAILGHGAIVHAYNSSSLPPHGSNYARGIHVDSPRFIPGYITNIGLALPLDEFTLDNGAMEIWPASFGMPAAPGTEQFDANKVILVGLRPGDALVSNARCWHRSGVNKTSTWRRAVTMNVCRAYMRQQFDFPRLIPREIEQQLNEDVRQFLGYHVRMPTTFDEFLAPPDERPYRPGQE